MSGFTYRVYILIGVTNDLLGRIEAHQEGCGSQFTSRYGVKMLVYYEPFASINEAIQRE